MLALYAARLPVPSLTRDGSLSPDLCLASTGARTDANSRGGSGLGGRSGVPGCTGSTT